MITNNRLFSCKYEELLPVSKFTLFSLKRDIAEFTAFSNMFSDEYVTQTEAMINTVENLLEPKAETLMLSMIAQTMEQQATELGDQLNFIDGYLKLLKTMPGMTAKAFGISDLRISIRKRDYEGVLKGLKILLSNVQNHLSALQGKGMPATMPQTLQGLHDDIAQNRLKQFEIKSNRAGIVQNNLKTLNELYMRMTEIYSIGKVLYKNTDPAKYADYTFTKLLKKVRNAKASSATADNAVAPDANTANN